MEKKRVLKFGKIAIPGYNAGRKCCAVEIVCTLRDWNGYNEIAITCNVWNSRRTDLIMGGQCLDEVKLSSPNFLKIKNFWSKYHLTDLDKIPAEDKDYYLGLFC